MDSLSYTVVVELELEELLEALLAELLDTLLTELAELPETDAEEALLSSSMAYTDSRSPLCGPGNSKLLVQTDSDAVGLTVPNESVSTSETSHTVSSGSDTVTDSSVPASTWS